MVAGRFLLRVLNMIHENSNAQPGEELPGAVSETRHASIHTQYLFSVSQILLQSFGMLDLNSWLLLEKQKTPEGKLQHLTKKKRNVGIPFCKYSTAMAPNNANSLLYVLGSGTITVEHCSIFIGLIHCYKASALASQGSGSYSCYKVNNN